MSDREQAEVPDGSVVITPTEMYREMQDIGRKVDKLSSALDPWQAEIRNEIAGNREKISQAKADQQVEHARIEERIEKIRSERVKQASELERRLHDQETAGYVTSGRMWVAVATLAAVVTAIAAVAVLLIR